MFFLQVDKCPAIISWNLINVLTGVDDQGMYTNPKVVICYDQQTDFKAPWSRALLEKLIITELIKDPSEM